MTVDRTDALDCGICFLPLKPPIFQCDVGHVVCSPCRDKLAAAGGRCHVCRDATGFRRCHAMEQLVDAIRAACPHAGHGCTARPAYHDRERHAGECAHAPLRCPGDACGFVGPAPALAEHAAAAHGWRPCAAEAIAGASFRVDLRDGFNLITAARGGAAYLFLLNVATTPFGRAVSVVRLVPQAPAWRSTTCELQLYYVRLKDFCREHYYQTSRFEVADMDPASDELQDPSASFQFLVPKCVSGYDEADFRVTVVITIS
ncbi:hypothetical protein HU200_007927 [Digitaria exilis]|uniref:RING-type E3 ubiquitin transferase n=1 Tax=Digitaria exilis TaxID=1010633 RepID=A0A835KU25_9POAL|nr:hypothetical protein HU200_007927 [Digitaria exilis]